MSTTALLILDALRTNYPSQLISRLNRHGQALRAGHAAEMEEAGYMVTGGDPQTVKLEAPESESRWGKTRRTKEVGWDGGSIDSIGPPYNQEALEPAEGLNYLLYTSRTM